MDNLLDLEHKVLLGFRTFGRPSLLRASVVLNWRIAQPRYPWPTGWLFRRVISLGAAPAHEFCLVLGEPSDADSAVSGGGQCQLWPGR